MKNKNVVWFVAIASALVVSFSPTALAVQYIITGVNVSDGNSDRVVVDNTGALTNGNSIAAVGYFKTITDPTMSSSSALVSDFEILASSDFSESGAGFNGLYNIDRTIDPAESNAAVVAGNGKAIYLFFGNRSTLAGSSQIGLIGVNNSVPDVTVPASSYTTDVPYSGSDFGTGGSIILGQLTNDNVSWGGGTSTGAFQLVAVPEPSSTALLGLGGLALILRRRR